MIFGPMRTKTGKWGVKDLADVPRFSFKQLFSAFFLRSELQFLLITIILRACCSFFPYLSLTYSSIKSVSIVFKKLNRLEKENARLVYHNNSGIMSLMQTSAGEGVSQILTKWKRGSRVDKHVFSMDVLYVRPVLL